MFSCIVSCTDNYGIGNNGDMIYHISEDLKRFKRITLNHKVIMGRKTFDSLPNKQPLKDRDNIIITNDISNFLETHSNISSLSLTSDIPELINKYYNSKEEVFIIGGSSIYKTFLPYCKKIYFTRIYDKPKNADAFFPKEPLMLCSIEHVDYVSDKYFDDKNKIYYRYIDITLK